MSKSSARTLAIVLLIVGLVLVAVGIVYFTVPATKLPALLGQLHHGTGTGHRTKRGIASLGLGVLSLIGTAIAFARSRRQQRHSH